MNDVTYHTLLISSLTNSTTPWGYFRGDPFYWSLLRLRINSDENILPRYLQKHYGGTAHKYCIFY